MTEHSVLRYQFSSSFSVSVWKQEQVLMSLLLTWHGEKYVGRGFTGDLFHVKTVKCSYYQWHVEIVDELNVIPVISSVLFLE